MKQLITVLALLITVGILFQNLPVFGTSPAIFPLLLLCVLVLVSMAYRKGVTLGRDGYVLVLLPWLIPIFMAISFLITGSTEGSDIRYILSLVSNIIWLPAIYILMKLQLGFSVLIKWLVITLVCSVILMFVFFVLQTGDPFFFRVEEGISLLRDNTVFRNPNHFARLVMALMVLLLLHGVLVSKKYRIDSWHFFLLLVLSALIVMSLSRTNIVTLIIFWFMFSSINAINRGSAVQMGRKLTFIILLLILSAVVLEYSSNVSSRLDQLSNIYFQFLDADRGVSIDYSGARVRTWHASFEIMKEYPVFGLGYSGLSDALYKLGSFRMSPNGEFVVVWVHGVFFEFVNIGGFFSFVPLVIFFIANFMVARKRIKRTNNIKTIAVCKIWQLYVIVLSVGSFSGSSLNSPAPWVFLAVIGTAALAEPLSKKMGRVGVGPNL